MRAARRSALPSASRVALAVAEEPCILDKQACLDVLARLVLDGVFSIAQAKYWRAIFERVDFDTRIVQPGAESDDLPKELAKLAEVNRSYHFKFCNAMGPDISLGEHHVRPHHLILRIHVPPNGTFPIDGRVTSSGGTGLLLLFEDAADFDRKARLWGDRSPPEGTQVPQRGLKSPEGDSSPPKGTPSIFVASQTERDRDDLSVEISNPALISPPATKNSPPPLQGSARELAGGNSQEASADARTTARATSRETAAPGVVRTSLREGVSRQQSTANSPDANALREGQKSRGSSAHADAFGASDDEIEIVRRVLLCWADLFGRNREDAFSPGRTALLIRHLRTGLSPWQLVKVIGGAKQNTDRFHGMMRTNLEFIFGGQGHIDNCLAACRESFMRLLCDKYGVPVPPRPKNASTGRPGANAQSGASGVDSTERTKHSLEQITQALNGIGVGSSGKAPRPGGRKKGSNEP